MIMALLVISAIVMFHEFGHFLLARLNGIAVVEFSLGFGPRLISWQSKKNGTRYSWKLIPFGGSCAMMGEFDDESGQNNMTDEGTFKEGSLEAKMRDEFADGRYGDSFFKKSPWARFSVIAAGPLFNFILAFVLALVVVAWSGYDYPEITEVSGGYAAEMAGIEPGDVITKIGDRKVYITRDIILYMMFHSGEDLEVEYRRQDETTGAWTTYEAVLDFDHFYYQDGRYLSGMTFSGSRSATDSPLTLLKCGVAEIRYVILSVIDSLGQMVQGQVSKDDIAGPIRIVGIIGDTVEQVSPYGFVYVIMNVFNLMIMFSANLGVMNLLPFPALDGGRLVFILIEILRGRPLNQRIENAVNFAGMMLLMGFMVFVLFNDISFLFK